MNTKKLGVLLGLMMTLLSIGSFGLAQVLPAPASDTYQPCVFPHCR